MAENFHSSRDSRTRIIRKPLDQIVNNSIVLINDIDLWANLNNNTFYVFSLGLMVNSPAAQDLDWTLQGGTFVTQIIEWAPGAPLSLYNRALAYEGTLATTGGATLDMLILSGYIFPTGGADIFQLQWAQHTAAVADTTVKAGSFLRLEEMI